MSGRPPLPVEYVSLSDREARAQHIARRYQHMITGRVLDVGCDTKRIKTLLPHLDYFGIDVGGDPDMHVDLERPEPLPFESRSFDTVLCTDVLEHLDRLHAVFGELARICRRHLIVSLPNCWYSFRNPIRRGRGPVRHYGLPLDPPSDRHKWMFNVDEVTRFLDASQTTHGYRLVEWSASVNPGVKNRMRRVVHPKKQPFLNRYAHTVWAVMRFDRD